MPSHIVRLLCKVACDAPESYHYNHRHHHQHHHHHHHHHHQHHHHHHHQIMEGGGQMWQLSDNAFNLSPNNLEPDRASRNYSDCHHNQCHHNQCHHNQCHHHHCPHQHCHHHHCDNHFHQRQPAFLIILISFNLRGHHNCATLTRLTTQYWDNLPNYILAI